MLPKSILALIASLALVSSSKHIPTDLTTTTVYHPPAPLSASSHCKLTYTVTYQDAWGPIFIENRYTCDLPPLSSTHTPQIGPSFRIPPPYSHPAGRHHNPHPPTYPQLQHSSLSKHTVTSFGCAPLPSSRPLSRNKYSNLFWGISQLTNQSCLGPSEAVEFVDLRRDWTADWRFTNVNRGAGRLCDWYDELANVARALHYFCFHTLGRPAEEEFSGGEEIVAYGRDSALEQLWCLRYSEKGWGTAVFDEKCLGV